MRGNKTLLIENFKGVDLTNQPAGVDIHRSAGGVNMIRDVPGKVRKRRGYFLRESYAGRINGIWHFEGLLLVHAGCSIYCGTEEIYSDAADRRSCGIALAGAFWVLDGKALLKITADGQSAAAARAEDSAFVPTVSIGRSPKGGGTAYQPLNLLSSRVTDSFLGTGEDTEYQLSFPELGEAAVEAQKMVAAGQWQSLAEGEDFTVDRAAGRVSFVSPPGMSPVTGEDNITVRYSLADEKNKERINSCRFGICYGAAGAADRLFAAGNEKMQNRDFYCAPGDPTYWGDVWYGSIGAQNSPITGYSVIGGALATHKLSDHQSRNVVLRQGENHDGTTTFPVSGVIQGAGALSPWSFAYMGEPLFLTAGGICATTPYDYSGERYIQQRSFYLNGGLLKEPQLQQAYACAYGDFYLLAVEDRVYVLDTLCKDHSGPQHSDYQYEGYLLQGIPARVMCCDGQELLFGTAAGELLQLHRDTEDMLSYSDMGRAIQASWDIDLSGDEFFKNKTLRRVAVRLAAYANTSVSVWRRVRGVWSRLFSEGAGARFFSFSNLCFSKWSFSCDSNPRTLVRRAYIRKADSMRLSFRNGELQEPFGLFQLALEFSEEGIYKGR